MKRKKHGCLKSILKVCVTLVFVLGLVLFAFLKMDLCSGSDGKEIGLFEKVPYQKVEEDTSESPDAEITNSYFYYGLLTEEEKLIYREILCGLEEQKENIYIHCEKPDTANGILKDILRDHPECFWCDGASTTISYSKALTEEKYSVITPTYNCSKEERVKRQEEIDLAVQQIMQNVDAAQSEYEKILFVYEYIINNTDYDKGAEDNQNIYSVFYRKSSVCAGYAKSVQYLLQKMGVYAVYVTGTTDEGSLHAWNIVKCDDRFYHVDATWGDPVYQQTEENQPSEFQNITYDYMCCDDENILKTHCPDPDYPYPECDSMACNYYVVQGNYYDDYDRDTILSVMDHTMYERRNPTVFKFSNSGAYEQAKDAILTDLSQITAQNFCRYYGMSEARFYYQDEAELNKFTLYWEYP